MRSPRCLAWFPWALLVALWGCGDRPQVWERLDLHALELAEQEPVGALSDLALFLGPEDVRDPARVSPHHFERVARVSAGRLRGMAQQPQSRVSWRLPSSRTSYLSVVPMASAGCALEATIRADRKVLWQGTLSPAEPFAEAALELSLPARSARLSFEVGRGADGCRALWGEGAVNLLRRHRRLVPAQQPNIILLGLDTLRADAVGPWGRTPSLTPALDRLALESDVYLEAFASANATNPSFASLLTGLWVKNHGVVDLATPLPHETPTLQGRLSAAGWDTMAVLAAGHVPPALAHGFAESIAPEGTFAGQTAVDLAIEWLGVARERPFFLWLHLFDPHTPHTPPRPYAEGRAAAAPFGFAPLEQWRAFRSGPIGSWQEPVLGASSELYDAEVAYTDRQVDRFLGWVESRGLLDNTVVVVVADHGENTGDHGIAFRHAGLWDSTVHVPLMVRPPGPRRVGTRQTALVQHFDVAATILEQAGLDATGLDAVALDELVRRGGRRMVFAEHSDDAGAMIRTRSHKLITLSPDVSFAPPGVAFYDLDADPHETTNLDGRGLEAQAILAQALARWQENRRTRAAPRTLTPEEESELRALGYL